VSPHRLRTTAAALLGGVLLAGAAQAATSPAQFADFIDRRVSGTSFATLRAFGEAAARRNDREGLRRLAFVADVLRNQSDFADFARLNAALSANAAAQGDARYIAIATLFAAQANYQRGEQRDLGAIQHLLDSPDWVVRSYAASAWAAVLAERQQSGDALRLLSQAASGAPAHLDDDARMALSQVWEAVGVTLVSLHDLQDSTDAFARSQMEYAPQGYPRPDFDDIYNLGHIAIELGDRKVAGKLVAIHHRLTLGSDLPHLKPWDRNLCGQFAETFGVAKDVLDCFAGLPRDLDDAAFLAPALLPRRAIAEARLGRVADARDDVALLDRLAESGKYDPRKLLRTQEARGELLLAEGRTAEGLAALRSYYAQRDRLSANNIYGGVRQITGGYQAELASLRQKEAFEHRIFVTQRWLLALTFGLVLGGAAVCVLLLRSARRLRVAREEAEAANHAKSAFLATISHEIRTPLNGVLGMAQALAAGALAPHERDQVQVIQNSGKALLAILNDLLDVSKIEAGKLELEIVEFDLSELAHSAYAAFSAIAEDKGLAFELDVADAVGRYAGDPTRLRQILFNLISNALKFTETGAVRVGMAYREGMLEMMVSDTGPGIAPEHLPRVFAVFDQLDSSTTRRFGGTGLGLSICKDLAQLMAGEIVVQSRLNEGTTFTVRAPLPRLGEEHGAAPDPALAADQAAPALRVLAAEDNSVNQLVLKTLLAQFGVEPTVVGDGAQAVAAWETGDWDLILMDIQMPVLDGVGAARRIRDLERASGRTPATIVALSANAMSHQIAEYYAAGMDDHLAKPIEIPELLRILVQVAERPAEPAEATGEPAPQASASARRRK
jgi:signal transduction histidine kinase/CheY-like chemotaxis protein